MFGTDEKYLKGALRNAEQAVKFFPGWVPRFFVGNSINQNFVNSLIDRGSEVVRIAGPEDHTATLWRFKSFFDPEVSVVIVRDADSRLSFREAEAVNAWIASGLGFHIMRDHPAQLWPINAGMWGAHSDRMMKFKIQIENFKPQDFYGIDQKFLAKVIYPIAKKDAIIHDSFFACELYSKPFPSARIGLGFVGEIFDKNDKPLLVHRKMIELIESSFMLRIKVKLKSFFRGFHW